MAGNRINTGSCQASRAILFAVAVLVGCPERAMAQLASCQSGLAAYNAENFAGAVAPLTECLGENLHESARVIVLQYRAHAFMETGRFDRALIDQKESLRLERPKNVWPLVMLAVYHRKLKQYDLALAALLEARKFDEDGPGTGPGMAVNYHTGWTLHEAGRYAEAIAAYTAGIPRQPGYGWVYYRRALSYEAIGDRARAEEDLRMAANLEPDDGYEAEIVAKLDEYAIGRKAR